MGRTLGITRIWSQSASRHLEDSQEKGQASLLLSGSCLFSPDVVLGHDCVDNAASDRCIRTKLRFDSAYKDDRMGKKINKIYIYIYIYI